MTELNESETRIEAIKKHLFGDVDETLFPEFLNDDTQRYEGTIAVLQSDIQFLLDIAAHRESAAVAGALELGWVVGIFEGEGYCAFSDRTQKVQIPQKQRWILDKLSTKYGGQVAFRKYKSKNNPNVKDGSWQWAIYGENARKFLIEILPHLSPHKQEQARNALARRLNGRNTQ